VYLYDADRTDPVRTLKLPGQPKTFTWHPTDGRLAIRVGRQLWVCDPDKPDPPVLVFGEPNRPGPAPYLPSGGAAWHPNGRTVTFASPGRDGWSVHVIDPATRTTQSKFRAMPLTVWSVEWSPDGTRLTVAGDDPAIKVFDPTTGRLVQSLSGHTFTVRDLAYSPDGARLASAGLDGNVMLWDTKSGRLILTFEMGSPVFGVAWSKDGSKLAALPETGVVKVWDASSSK
jgi:WD40 repeat protein